MSIEIEPTMAQQVEFMGPSFDAAVPVAQTSDEYEFSVYENAVIKTLAGRMRAVAGITAAFAALEVVIAALAVMADPSLVIRAAIAAGVTAILAATLLKSAREFRAITESEGNDLRHLMTALGGLSQFFLVQCLVFVVAAGLVLVTVFVLLMAYG
ncbi:MAG: hypothetical protein U0269_33995 [Polyangiales bacterium]